MSLQDMGIDICAGANTWVLAIRRFPAEELVSGQVIPCRSEMLNLDM
ncbi:hypothetical protein VCRA2119O147_1090001 [Vibrio crassostreae]|nr:hypothetical protein VCRA2119O147_1090001 [Vibrio crassostreae]CAK2968382.1 hypothetical protein VCRA2110O183_500001 [Vibrio crassostreae]CAK3713187.1 hypothetical protein VCRA2121O262_500013 [Vibrio crassostreae]